MRPTRRPKSSPNCTRDFFPRAAIAMGDAPSMRREKLRLLEKTPKNALRVPFLRSVFPDARFLYLWREPEESLASMIEGWQSGLFVTYPDLPDWPGPKWSYLLVPGWRNLAGRPLHEIVAAQWRITQEHLLREMADIPPRRFVHSASTISSRTRSGRCAPSAISPVCVSIARRPRKCHFRCTR